MAAGGVLACARAAVSWPTRSARSAARWASARAARSSRLRRRTRPARMQKISHPATNPPSTRLEVMSLKRKQDARFDDQQIDADRSQSEREQRGADATEPHAQRDDEREWSQRKLRGAGAGKKDSGPRRDRDPGRRDSVRRHAPQEPAESRGLVHRSLAGHVARKRLGPADYHDSNDDADARTAKHGPRIVLSVTTAVEHRTKLSAECRFRMFRW